MLLKIAGTPRGMGVTQELLRDAFTFYLNILMREDLERIDQIEVQLNIIRNLKRDYNGCGFCKWTDDPLRPSKFLIEWDAEQAHMEGLISLAHESTHIKQMAFGHRQQSPLDPLKYRWMGQLIDTRSVHYYDLPWEVEAHGMEYGLYDRFLNSIDPDANIPVRDNSFMLKLMNLPQVDE